MDTVHNNTLPIKSILKQGLSNKVSYETLGSKLPEKEVNVTSFGETLKTVREFNAVSKLSYYQMRSQGYDLGVSGGDWNLEVNSDCEKKSTTMFLKDCDNVGSLQNESRKPLSRVLPGRVVFLDTPKSLRVYMKKNRLCKKNYFKAVSKRIEDAKGSMQSLQKRVEQLLFDNGAIQDKTDETGCMNYETMIEEKIDDLLSSLNLNADLKMDLNGHLNKLQELDEDIHKLVTSNFFSPELNDKFKELEKELTEAFYCLTYVENSDELFSVKWVNETPDGQREWQIQMQNDLWCTTSEIEHFTEMDYSPYACMWHLSVKYFVQDLTDTYDCDYARCKQAPKGSFIGLTKGVPDCIQALMCLYTDKRDDGSVDTKYHSILKLNKFALKHGIDFSVLIKIQRLKDLKGRLEYLNKYINKLKCCQSKLANQLNSADAETLLGNMDIPFSYWEKEKLIICDMHQNGFFKHDLNPYRSNPKQSVSKECKLLQKKSVEDKVCYSKTESVVSVSNVVRSSSKKKQKGQEPKVPKKLVSLNCFVKKLNVGLVRTKGSLDKCMRSRLALLARLASRDTEDGLKKKYKSIVILKPTSNVPVEKMSQGEAKLEVHDIKVHDKECHDKNRTKLSKLKQFVYDLFFNCLPFLKS